MKFLQLLCIALLLAAVFAVPLNAPNATEADLLLKPRKNRLAEYVSKFEITNAIEPDASLKSPEEKLADFMDKIEKIKKDGKFEDRLLGPFMPIIFEVIGNIVGDLVHKH